jgi:hypothetical protein
LAGLSFYGGVGPGESLPLRHAYYLTVAHGLVPELEQDQITGAEGKVLRPQRTVIKDVLAQEQVKAVHGKAEELRGFCLGIKVFFGFQHKSHFAVILRLSGLNILLPIPALCSIR